MNPSYSFKDNILVKNNKYLRFLDNSNVLHDIIGLDQNNNLQIKSSNANGNIFINNGNNQILSSNRSTIIQSKLGVGIGTAGTSLPHLINLPKNNVIGVSDSDSSGYLALAGSNSLTSGSSIIINGENSSSGNLLLSSESGNVNIFTQNLSRLQVNNSGSILLTPDGSTTIISVQNDSTNILNSLIINNQTNANSAGTAALTVQGGAYFEKDIYVNGVLYTENLATFKTLQSDLLSSAQLQITDTTNAINRSDGGAFTVAGGAAVNKNLIIGESLLYNTNAFSFAGSFLHTTDATVPTQLEGLSFDPIYVRSFTIEIAFKVQLSTGIKLYELVKVYGIQSSGINGWNITSEKFGGDNLNYVISHQIINDKLQLFYTSSEISNFQGVSVNYFVNGTANIQDIITLPSTINPKTYNLSIGEPGAILHYNQNGSEVVTSGLYFTSGKLVLTGSSLEVGGNINFTGDFLQNGEPFIGSQWIGDIGELISYTSGGVVVDTMTTGSLQVGGDINFTGDFLQNGETFVGSQWIGDIGELISYTSGGVVVDAMTTGSLQVGGDINFTGDFLQNGDPFIGSQWIGDIGELISYTSGGVVVDTMTTGNLQVGGDINFTGDFLQNGEPFAGSQWTSSETISIPEYKYIRWTITETLYPNDMVQVAEFILYKDNVKLDISNATVTNPGGSNPQTQTPPNLVDDNIFTKWLDFNASMGSATVIFTFPSPIQFNAYSWVTAEDIPNRDPKSWTISVSNDNVNWNIVDTVTGYIVPNQERSTEQIKRSMNIQNQTNTLIYYNEGNVGIGTNDTIYKLQVNGDMYTNTLRTSSLITEIPGNALLPLTNGLIAYYNGDSWDAVLNDWLDLSGNDNHVTNITGTVQVDTESNIKFIKGNTSTILYFPNGILPEEYTLFHIAKYTSTNSANRERIFTSTVSGVTNWLSGFWENRNGVAFHEGGFITQESVSQHGINNWVFSTDQNAIYRSQGIDRTVPNNSNELHAPLTINGATGESSDWAIAEVIVFNRTLTTSEIEQMESYLFDKYSAWYQSFTQNDIPTYSSSFPTGSVVSISTPPTINVIITSEGNVGIGKSNPSYKLDVNGTLNVSGNSEFNSPLILNDNKIYIRNNGDENHRLQFGSGIIDGPLLVGANGVALGRGNGGSTITDLIVKDGKVGIGTTNPNGTLHLGNSISNRRIILYENANNDHDFYGFGINNGMVRYQTAIGTNHVFYVGATSSSSNELMRLASNGNVGIGTTNPTSKLHVQGDINYTGQFLQNGSPFVGSQWSGSRGSIISYTSGSIIMGGLDTAANPSSFQYNSNAFFGSVGTYGPISINITLTDPTFTKSGSSMVYNGPPKTITLNFNASFNPINGGRRFKIVKISNGASTDVFQETVLQQAGQTNWSQNQTFNATFPIYTNDQIQFWSENCQVYIGSGYFAPNGLSYSFSTIFFNVGINNTSPSYTLDINGTLKTDNAVMSSLSILSNELQKGSTIVEQKTYNNNYQFGYQYDTYGPLYMTSDISTIFNQSILLDTNRTGFDYIGSTTPIIVDINFQFIITRRNSSTNAIISGPINMKFVKFNTVTSTVTDLTSQQTFESNTIGRFIDSFQLAKNEKFQIYVEAFAGQFVALNVGTGNGVQDGLNYKIYNLERASFLSASNNSLTVNSISTGSLIITNTSGNLVLASNGNIGVNTTSPTYSLDVNGTFEATGSAGSIVLASNGNVGIGITTPTSKLHVDGDIYASGDITAFSDARLKSDIVTITDALEKVSSMRGVYFTSTGSNKKSTGLIAQEIQKVIPEVINTTGEYLGVAYGNLVGLLIEAIKELRSEINELKLKI